MQLPETKDGRLEDICNGMASADGAAVLGSHYGSEDRELDDHDALGLCGEDHIGGCLI